MDESIKEKMTAKQVKFCQEYLIDLNGTQAAIRSGYSEETANVIASQNLTKLNIQAYIAELQEEAANSLKITKEKVLQGLKMLSFYDPRKFFDENGNLKAIADLDDETAFALSSFEITEERGGTGNQLVLAYTKKIKMNDRKGAIDMLNKMLGYYAPEKSEVKTLVHLTDEPIVFE